MPLNKQLIKKWLLPISVIGATYGIIASASYCSRSHAFEEGLRVKFEEVADTDKDGSLSIEEMVAVCDTLGVDQSQKLYEGFYFSIEQRQDYLKRKDKFNAETDTAWNVGKPSANYEKAIAEGKRVHHLQL